jgi:hypothetical protein
VASCLVLSKKARNVTKEITNANETRASSSDVIIYTLSVKNTGKLGGSYIVHEPMGDVLEYADITDFHGGKMNAKNVVSWPKETVRANGVINHQITVRVKSPVPQTPTPCPAEDIASPCPRGESFDLIMSNTFGNTININLPSSIPKTTEQVTTQELPKTGPGTTLMVGFAGAAVIGYFYSRSRLLAKELDIVRKDYNVGRGI